MAAEGMQFPWRWNGGTVSLNFWGYLGNVGSDIFVLLFALVVFGVGTYVWLGLFRD
jgi:hypothetical protein